MTQSSKELTISRLKLLLIAAIFFGPLIFAAVLYYGFPELIPAGRTEHGHLVNPARPLPTLSLYTADGQPADATIFEGDRWTILYFANRPCEKACRKRLYDTRQVRTALGREAPRVQRVYVASDSRYLPDAALVEKQHPDLKLYTTDQPGLRDWLNQTVEHAGANADVYVIDPLGNWVLYYQPKDPAKGLLKDLKHLLKLSHIG